MERDVVFLKKICLAFMLWFSLAVILATSAWAASSVELTGGGGKPGDSITLTVSAKGVKGFRSGTVRLSFDGNALEPVEVTPAEALGGVDISKITDLSAIEGETTLYSWGVQSDDDSSVLTIAYAGRKDVSTDGPLFTITCNIAENAEVSAEAISADVTLGSKSEHDVLDHAGARIEIPIYSLSVSINDKNSASVRGGYSGLYARVALVIENGGATGLYVTQSTIKDGVVSIPSFTVPGLVVKGVSVAIVGTLDDISSATPQVLAMDFKML